METIRIALFIALAVVLMLIWTAWQEDYGDKSPPATATAPQQAPPAEAKPGDVPMAPPPEAVTRNGGDRQDQPAVVSAPRAARIMVYTDVYQVTLDSLGGDLREARLLKYPVSLDTPEDAFALLEESPANLFVSQSGLLSKQPAPNHHALYSSAQQEYRLAEGKDELKVPLVWKEGGVEVTKIYTFRRGEYLIDLDYEIHNLSGTPWSGQLYGQFKRGRAGGGHQLTPTFTGGAVSTQDKPYEKISFDDMQDAPLNISSEGGWAAMIQHYFLAAWLPDTEELNHYYTKSLKNDRYAIGLITPVVEIAGGASDRLGVQLFIGPKLQNLLEETAPSLELTVDYGWLTFLSKPLFWLMEFIHKWVGNWGWSIIIITIIIKGVFYKLSETSYRSMANLKKVTPRLQQLKERYGDDRQKLSQAMMELYRREKINPMGGCWPILIQIPVFIALYWVLLESVELRQAPFILWLVDLSSSDPYYVLPILMGISMWFQQKLNPAPIDPMQQKIMMALPVVFTAFFMFFPSGLVLYWVVNNVLSIGQQWLINKRLGAVH
jgi:YidC/Oxa1 family membrane protein insertase